MRRASAGFSCARAATAPTSVTLMSTTCAAGTIEEIAAARWPPVFDIIPHSRSAASLAGAILRCRHDNLSILKDPKLQSHWNGMRKYFKDLANVRIVEIDQAPHAHAAARGRTATSPGDYYFYDMARAKPDIHRLRHALARAGAASRPSRW